ncbi:DUF4226 domain-containing protein [soil metagenome]
MTSLKELHDAVAHVGAVTGDPLAWRAGLAPQDVALVGVVVAPPAEIAAVLDKIKANHPSLFDPRTGAAVIPVAAPVPGAGEHQEGAGVTAIKKAEGDLAHQNSSTAQLDLLVVSAILNAHATTQDGGATLRRLQAEIEDAVRTRTDLDTPTGARDFQRYLIGKLRQIGAVVENASLDDSSKAVLAGAWTALYEASKTTNLTRGEPGTVSTTATTSPTVTPAAAQVPDLPVYGADLGSDPLLEQLLAQDPVAAPAAPMPTAPPAAAAQPMLPTVPGLPPAGLPTGGGGLPGLGSPTSGLGWPKTEEPLVAPGRDEQGALTLEDLLAETEPLDGLEPDKPQDDAEDSEKRDGGEPEVDQPRVQESTQVRLPDGDIVMAPTPQLAEVLTSAIGGTPIGEAFRQHGLPIPPPGTAVPSPVDPADVGTGDVGMFTDRQALALDRTRALLGGEIQPLANVSGPSFLGWIHPPQPGGSAPTATTPEGPASAPNVPAPTRPSSATAPGS